MMTKQKNKIKSKNSHCANSWI